MVSLTVEETFSRKTTDAYHVYHGDEVRETKTLAGNWI